MKSEPHYHQLDYQDRQTIAISLEQGLSMRAIGRVLNRSAATISREIARNSGGNGYSCRYAQQRRVRSGFSGAMLGQPPKRLAYMPAKRASISTKASLTIWRMGRKG